MAYDTYMSALKETREIDIENEAIIMSRLGVLLYKVCASIAQHLASLSC